MFLLSAGLDVLHLMWRGSALLKSYGNGNLWSSSSAVVKKCLGLWYDCVSSWRENLLKTSKMVAHCVSTTCRSILCTPFVWRFTVHLRCNVLVPARLPLSASDSSSKDTRGMTREERRKEKLMLVLFVFSFMFWHLVCKSTNEVFCLVVVSDQKWFYRTRI
jgi:hypothetical protein